MFRITHLLLFISAAIFSSQAFAVRGSSSSGGGGLSSLSGTSSIGIYGGIVNSSQDDLNTLQSRANTREGGITTGQLTQAYEIAGHITYRYSGTMYALQFRPSYFYERNDGHGGSGSFTYGVTGWTVFPLLRIYPLENDFVKFYMQVGLGYGQVKASVNEGLDATGTNRHVNFGSDGFGSLLGMGAEFAMTPQHAFSAEVNYRYLTFSRNLASSTSGTFANSGANPSLSQTTTGREVELDGTDLALKMGGLQFLLGYSYYF